MWRLTPSTPTAARLNSVSRSQRAEANVSLTPRRPVHEAEFSSSRRNGGAAGVGDRDVRRDGLGEAGEERSASRLAIDAIAGSAGSLTQPRSG